MQYIVVDPSCSGSGIVNRMDGIIDEKEDKLKEEVRSAANESQRLNELSECQLFSHFCRKGFYH